jgi:probable phosphoglycerate mutase
VTRRLIVQADGGSRGNPGLAAYGAVVLDGATGAVLAERAAYLGEAVTNNVAEYSGLIAGLEAALAIDGTATLDVRLDSKLVVSQMSGAWKIKNAELQVLARRAHALVKGCQVTFTWVPRADNARADALANEAMDSRGTVSRDFAAGSGEAAGVAVPDAAGLAQAVRSAQRANSGAQRPARPVAPPTTVILIRHGMTADTDRNVFAGQALPGPDLHEYGRAQAAAAARELAAMLAVPWYGLEAPTRLLASPTARTLQTAAALAEVLGLEVEEAPGFIEQNFGQWDGLTGEQVEATHPDGPVSWRHDPDFAPPGGESRTQLGVRVKAALNDLVARYRGQTVVVAAHTMSIRAALGAALGAPPGAWNAFRVQPASINIIRLWEPGLTEIVCTSRTVA